MHWQECGRRSFRCSHLESGGEKTLIEDVESDCWSVFEAYAEVRQFGHTKKNISALWYKDPSSEWLEKDLKLFAGDRDALEMCRIMELRSHVELFVVYKVEDVEGFPEGQQVERDNAEQVNEGDKLYPDVEAENARVESNSDDDSDDTEFIPSDLEIDSADDIQFTDSEEEYDDESGFEELRGATDSDRVDKGKGVVNGDFSDEEGFNSDEVDLDYEVGGGSDKEDRQDNDNDEATRYLIHKDIKDMTSYKWEVGTIYASREEFKDTVTTYAMQTRRGMIATRSLSMSNAMIW
ncbi:hypothetical protein Ahy_B06g084953 [Arachis hypogaea]|uniref:PB1-like domain-containing protein n=1 Tax=Arachis hypogaea TaxID=3818 RepID=A0A444YT62_ARAHY|nr:hypothetical protein Ahy_B06g084953 [Arachis hypogaea]